ncbi:MAG: hypothetical protein HZB82_00800 [Deltaproteobacteria bacterium]|nr:hypothetical protein [Deltaproteobacteria bacterium]
MPKVFLYRYRQYRNRDRNAREHFLIEVPLIIVVCAVLAAAGFPSAVKGSVVGIIISVAGAGGIVALVVGAVISEYLRRVEQGRKYTYADFVPSIFVFCLVLGFSAGLLTGGVIYKSRQIALIFGLAGLLAGYAAGIFAGRWIHCLGFMAIWFIYLANLATLLMLIDDGITIFLVFK